VQTWEDRTSLTPGLAHVSARGGQGPGPFSPLTVADTVLSRSTNAIELRTQPTLQPDPHPDTGQVQDTLLNAVLEAVKRATFGLRAARGNGGRALFFGGSRGASDEVTARGASEAVAGDSVDHSWGKGDGAA
jgi:hypothetical protein